MFEPSDVVSKVPIRISQSQNVEGEKKADTALGVFSMGSNEIRQLLLAFEGL